MSAPDLFVHQVWSGVGVRRFAVVDARGAVAITDERWLGTIPFARVLHIDLDRGSARTLARVWLCKPTSIAWSSACGACALTYNGLLLSLTTAMGGVIHARPGRLMPAALQLRFVAHLLRGWLALGLLLAESVLGSVAHGGSLRAKARRFLQDLQSRAAQRLHERALGSFWPWPTHLAMEPGVDNAAPPTVLLATSTGLYRGRLGAAPSTYEVLQDGLLNCVHFTASCGTSPARFIVCEGYLHYPDLVDQGRSLGAIWSWTPKDGTWTLIRGFLAGPSGAARCIRPPGHVILAAGADGKLAAWWQPDGAQAVARLPGLEEPSQVEPSPDGSLLVLDKRGLHRIQSTTTALHHT